MFFFFGGQGCWVEYPGNPLWKGWLFYLPPNLEPLSTNNYQHYAPIIQQLAEANHNTATTKTCYMQHMYIRYIRSQVYLQSIAQKVCLLVFIHSPNFPQSTPFKLARHIEPSVAGFPRGKMVSILPSTNIYIYINIFIYKYTLYWHDSKSPKRDTLR